MTVLTNTKHARRRESTRTDREYEFFLLHIIGRDDALMRRWRRIGRSFPTRRRIAVIEAIADHGGAS
jgi:hypothetical protein